MFLTKTFVIYDYLYVPKLDGTETIHQVQGTTTISNNELSGGSGYLTSAWDNTGDWECSFKYKASGGRAGALIIKSDETSRDNNEILVRGGGSYVYVNGSSQAVSVTILSNNTYYDVKLTKQNGTLTLELNNNQYTLSWSLISTLSTLCIGVDSWGDTATIKDIVVKPL